MRKTLIATAAVAALACGSANAAIDIYVAGLLGANECGGSPISCGTFGDPDGYGGATVMIDNLTNTVTWSIMAMEIDMPLVGAHIHSGSAGTNGPVIINFNAQLSGTTVDTDAVSITPASAMNFYVNLHNATYQGGAIRGQLMYAKTVNPPVPEPSTYALMLAGLGMVGWLAKRRRTAA